MRTPAIRSNQATRRPTFTLVAAVLISAVPLLILVVPAVMHLAAVEPLLHDSEFFPGFSRAFLVALPLAGLVLVNAVVFAATRSLRSVAVVACVTSAVAWLLVLGAVGLVNSLTELSGGVD